MTNTSFRLPGGGLMMVRGPVGKERHHWLATAQSERVAAVGGRLAAHGPDPGGVLFPARHFRRQPAALAPDFCGRCCRPEVTAAVTEFVPPRLIGDASAAAELTLVLSDGLRLEIGPECRAETLKRVLGVLREPA
ncbi:MAG: hypothetical protein R6U98_00705 [Pirellulaceae bacterium]